MLALLAAPTLQASLYGNVFQDYRPCGVTELSPHAAILHQYAAPGPVMSAPAAKPLAWVEQELARQTVDHSPANDVPPTTGGSLQSPSNDKPV